MDDTKAAGHRAMRRSGELSDRFRVVAQGRTFHAQNARVAVSRKLRLTLQRGHARVGGGGGPAGASAAAGSRERLALKSMAEGKIHFEIYERLREEMGMKTSSHGSMENAKMLKPPISCRGSGPAKKKKEVLPVPGSREEEDA